MKASSSLPLKLHPIKIYEKKNIFWPLQTSLKSAVQFYKMFLSSEKITKILFQDAVSLLSPEIDS